MLEISTEEDAHMQARAHALARAHKNDEVVLQIKVRQNAERSKTLAIFKKNIRKTI